MSKRLRTSLGKQRLIHEAIGLATKQNIIFEDKDWKNLVSSTADELIKFVVRLKLRELND